MPKLSIIEGELWSSDVCKTSHEWDNSSSFHEELEALRDGVLKICANCVKRGSLDSINRTQQCNWPWVNTGIRMKLDETCGDFQMDTQRRL